MGGDRRSAIEDTLRSVALDVGPLLDDSVFVGGAATMLLFTDPAAAIVRPTDDVDVVVEVATRSEYDRMSERLRELGLRHDTSEGAPVCRWITPTDGLRLDVMPSEADVLGFSNPWYPMVLRTAEPTELSTDTTIRLVTGPCYLATKWAAYQDRRSDDPLASRDLEDIVMLVTARPEITGEVSSADRELRTYVATQTRELLRAEEADYILHGTVPDAGVSAEFVAEVRRRLEDIAALA